MSTATAASHCHRPWLAIVLVVALAVGLGAALVGLPREHAALPAIARRALAVALPRWHITEPVNEVVYGTRGFDTFGETFLLLAAVVSVVVLTRRREARAGPGGEEAAGAREEREIDPEQLGRRPLGASGPACRKRGGGRRRRERADARCRAARAARA